MKGIFNITINVLGRVFDLLVPDEKAEKRIAAKHRARFSSGLW